MAKNTLSSEDRQLLQAGYNKYLHAPYSGDCDLTQGYAIFGKCGVALCRRVNGRWQRKIVNNWHQKSLDRILSELDELDWEKLD